MADPITARSVPTLNIISAHKISTKITRALQLLYPTDADEPPAIALRAKSAVASKAITISEILKRRLSERGDAWWQYAKLEAVVVEAAARTKEPENDKGEPGGNVAGKVVEGADDGEDDPFVPLQEKIPGKKRTVPMLTIYVARRPIEFEGLENLYGVQTSGGGT